MLLPLGIAAVTILASIAWDYYKTKTALELVLITRSTVVGGTPSIDQLKFFYDGRAVPSVSKLDFQLLNNGRTPLHQRDVVMPPTITFKGGAILDVRLQGTEPRAIQAGFRTDSARQQVTLSFSLLNSGDVIRFTVLLAGLNIVVQPVARISGVRQLQYSERPPGTERESDISAADIVIALASAACLLLFAVSLYLLGIDVGVRRMFELGHVVIPTGGTPEEYKTFLARLPSTKAVDIAETETYLNQLPSGEVLSAQSAQHARDMIAVGLRQVWYSKLGAVLFGILAAVGISYLILTHSF